MPIDEKMFLLGECFKRHVKWRPNYEFLIDWASGKGKRRLTYKQAAEDVNRLCSALKDLGLKKGDMVATLGYNSIEIHEVILGSSVTGYVFGCQNPDLPDDWLATIINDRMAAKVVFFDDEYRDKVKRLMPRFKSVQHYICLDGPSEDRILNFHELVSKYEPKEVEVEVEPDDLMCVYMSGGTTGMPKAAMWTSGANYWTAVHTEITLEGGPEDTAFFVSPIFVSVAVLGGMWPALLAGTKIVIFRGKALEPGSVELFCEAVDKEKIKWGFIPGIWALEVAKWPEGEWKKYDLRSLCAAPWGITVPYPVWKTFWERWGIIIGPKLHASGEIGAALYASSTSLLKLLKEGREEPFLSFGYDCSFVNRVRLVDSEGNDVKPGEVGELIVKGPGIAHGYLGEPERWAKRYKEGWIYSGDLFRTDESGYFYIQVKREDIGMCPVDRGGKYVLPYPIQNAVTGMDEVVESSLIAVPDPEYKAKFRIIVRPKGGIELSADEVLKVAAKVAPDYLIKDVIIRKEPIPKNPVGKILIRALAEEYGGIIPEE